jgi:2-oxoglutarate dehydrogenase E2 component (dihydrolipoamide succinyltransferase)
MKVPVLIPSLGDSVTEAKLLRWHKQDGDVVAQDEPLCELETDKANVDMPSPGAGRLSLKVEPGAMVQVGQLVAEIDTEAKAGAGTTATAPAKSDVAPAALAPMPPSAPPLAASAAASATPTATMVAPPRAAAPAPTASAPRPPIAIPGGRREPMTRIRKMIAERLVAAKNETAMLTTFNEVDMTEIQRLREENGAAFEKEHGVKLGIMAFFARAVARALKDFPAVNALIDGEDVVYFDEVHLGVAVSTERGLVVPVLRSVDQMSFAKIELEIKRVATAARAGKLGIAELSGGTFTITNGGVFGSLLSTPILNMPQTGILGMHAIQRRPVAVGDKVEIRPMMYVALSYDHRLVDGKDSVSFLVKVKQLLEEPARLIFDG